jgi:1-deoxy-D-xylulose-5-phosphate reductoisomerase
MRTVCILGSTGSVGKSSLRVLAELAATHRVEALVARGSVDELVAQALEFRPRIVGMIDESAARAARERLRPLGIEVVSGENAAVDVVRAAACDVVVAAITGAAGLASSLETVRQGKLLALANKESLVMAGGLLTRLARQTGAAIIPVDSEHSAIFQSLAGSSCSAVRRLYLTASGGPFVDLPAERFADVKPEAALVHPTWKMGPKITIDSATMMNKALEIIEARWLFDVGADRIDVLVHRQSIVHSMVEFIDGSILAQLGVPSMTVPIRYAVAWPDRAPTNDGYFDLARFARLTFEAPDHARFPALGLGARAAREGGLAGAALNAANEVAVSRFLEGRLRFDRIAITVEQVLDQLRNVPDPSLEEILEADRSARQEAERCLTRC